MACFEESPSDDNPSSTASSRRVSKSSSDNDSSSEITYSCGLLFLVLGYNTVMNVRFRLQIEIEAE